MPVIMVNNASAGGGPPPATPRIAFVSSHSSSESNVASHDYTSVSFGTDTADRQIHVIVMINADAAGTISCEIGDDAAPTLDASRVSGTQRSVHIFRGSPTGTSGTIHIATTGNFDDAMIAVYRSTDDLVPFEVNTFAYGTLLKYQFGIEIPDLGCVIAGAMASSSSNTNSQAWVGLTEDAFLEDGNMLATNAYGVCSAASLDTHTGQSVAIITQTQDEAFNTVIAAVAYGQASDTPSLTWTTVFSGAFGGTSGVGSLLNDTVRSRLDDSALSSVPGSPTHIRITTYAGSGGGWGCDKSYVGNALSSPDTDASSLLQLTFDGSNSFANATREATVSDPLAFVYSGGTTPLQFSWLVANDAALDSPPYQILVSSPWNNKSDVDEAATAAVTGYTGQGSGLEMIGIYRVEIGA